MTTFQLSSRLCAFCIAWAVLSAGPCGAEDTNVLPPGIAAAAGDIRITEAELYDYIIDLHGSAETGRSLLEQMIRETAIRQESAHRKLYVSDQAVEARAQELDAALNAHFGGQKGLTDYIREQGVDEREFFAALKLSIAHEEMARADFGLKSGAAVPVEELNLWLTDLLGKKEVVRPESGPVVEGGPAAVVDCEEISRAEFGRRLASHLGREAVGGILTEMVGIRLIPAKARQLGLTLTDGDLDAEIRLRERALQSQEGFAEISFGDFLQAATGQSADELRQSPKFQAEVLMKKIARAMLAENDLRDFFEKHEDAFESSYGRAARIATIFLEAARFPNQHVSRTFDDAAEELEAIAKRLKQGETTFENIARIYSEHESGKKGGDLGFVGPADKAYGNLAAAALDAETGAILGPINATDGVHLIQVVAKRGPVEFGAVREEVAVAARQALYRDLIREACVVKKY